MLITEPMSTRLVIQGHSPVVKPNPERSPAALCNNRSWSPKGKRNTRARVTVHTSRPPPTHHWEVKVGGSKGTYKGFNVERKH